MHSSWFIAILACLLSIIAAAPTEIALDDQHNSLLAVEKRSIFGVPEEIRNKITDHPKIPGLTCHNHHIHKLNETYAIAAISEFCGNSTNLKTQVVPRISVGTGKLPDGRDRRNFLDNQHNPRKPPAHNIWVRVSFVEKHCMGSFQVGLTVDDDAKNQQKCQSFFDIIRENCPYGGVFTNVCAKYELVYNRNKDHFKPDHDIGTKFCKDIDLSAFGTDPPANLQNTCTCKYMLIPQEDTFVKKDNDKHCLEQSTMDLELYSDWQLEQAMKTKTS